jgi:hypothetical protein
MHKPAIAALVPALLLGITAPALAWGDLGHEVIGLVANHYLKPAVRTKVHTLLAGDSTHLTPTTGIADEATWADKFRDSDRNTIKVRYELTEKWHFVDIQVDGSTDIDAACFSHPAPSPKASEGPAQSCVVDRINAFSAELGNPNTDAKERRLALQFLLHFMGDVHQPLHSSADHDKGGNDKSVKATDVATGTLHHYWDTEFVKDLGGSPAGIANNLIHTMTAAQIKAWKKGDATSWAKQTFKLSKLRVYGDLGPPDAGGKYTLSASYVTKANAAVARQLARAGVRLAEVLNDSLQ